VLKVHREKWVTLVLKAKQVFLVNPETRETKELREKLATKV